MSDTPATTDLPVAKRSKWFWLRIAVSVFFGVLAVALCVLCVRSYHAVHYLHADLWQMHSAGIHSYRGTATFYAMSNNIAWCSRLRKAIVERQRTWMVRSNFGYGTKDWESWLHMPYWFLTTTTCSAVFIAFPARLRFAGRFSLRSLLIATTLLAITLGLGVWLAR